MPKPGEVEAAKKAAEATPMPPWLKHKPTSMPHWLDLKPKRMPPGLEPKPRRERLYQPSSSQRAATARAVALAPQILA